MDEYKKIWGLKYLEKNGFSVPSYVVLDLNKINLSNVKKYISEKIENIGIPSIENDRIGVTIRVSLPGILDKKGKHGGIHFTDLGLIVDKILELHDRYMPEDKIIIQHTIDAKYSGTILMENDNVIIETIPGDAPPLLEGRTSNYECWEYSYRWIRVKTYQINKKTSKKVGLAPGTLVHIGEKRSTEPA